MTGNNTATYYMVEMDYPHETAAQRDTFDAYYARHIDMLLTIPGFLTAQRFYCANTASAPFLALYRLAGPDVLTSEAYTSKAGRMSVHPDFRAYISDWDRNLVQGRAGSGGPDLVPAMGDTMTVIDRLTPDAAPFPDDVMPLDVIGLDRTIAQRGVVQNDWGRQPGSRDGWDIRAWQPIHPVRRPV